MKENTYRIPYVSMLLLVIITSAFGLFGCSQKLDASLHEGAGHGSNRVKDSPGPSFLGAEIVPIEMGEQEEFYKSAGWVSDSEILYISNKGDSTSLLYSYNLGTGKASLLYRSEQPIITAIPSPEKTKVMIHSAASEEGILIVIDLSGKELYSTSIQSYELTFEWNPFDENLIEVSAFTEDWDFNSYLLDLKSNNLKEIKLPEPFVRWISEDDLVYQEWDEDGISLKAPLRIFSLKGNKTETLVEDVYQFDSQGPYLMAVKVNEEENQESGLYAFFRNGGKSVGSIEAPFLTSFSGWVVPFYDLMENGKNFIYLRATEQGEADLYDRGFDLMRYHLDTGNDEVLFTEMANEPLSCSPSGELCLYGFQFDKVLNIETKEIIDLVH
ncbi:hypothetical protein LC048_05370 [Mesobacillus subterraneus]|uniref:YqgU-like beta propeller domain-containing protein n=1 Tax=Mesobacillus subterraneus TaxID=285983 RepID=UPI001CFD802A|nr:hypothetical protein [Mesobacillus subterraneus]WLR56351.1 hypothetical protein LC048_05370 [Mesobacillus subterraneus]